MNALEKIAETLKTNIAYSQDPQLTESRKGEFIRIIDARVKKGIDEYPPESHQLILTIFNKFLGDKVKGKNDYLNALSLSLFFNRVLEYDEFNQMKKGLPENFHKLKVGEQASWLNAHNENLKSTVLPQKQAGLKKPDQPILVFDQRKGDVLFGYASTIEPKIKAAHLSEKTPGPKASKQ